MDPPTGGGSRRPVSPSCSPRDSLARARAYSLTLRIARPGRSETQNLESSPLLLPADAPKQPSPGAPRTAGNAAPNGPAAAPGLTPGHTSAAVGRSGLRIAPNGSRTRYGTLSCPGLAQLIPQCRPCPASKLLLASAAPDISGRFGGAGGAPDARINSAIHRAGFSWPVSQRRRTICPSTSLFGGQNRNNACPPPFSYRPPGRLLHRMVWPRCRRTSTAFAKASAFTNR
jgi:hypothetical protein